MTNEEMDREPDRDPRLAEALRRADPPPPDDTVNWAAMRTAIAARAEIPLARLRFAAAPPRRARSGFWRRAVAIAPIAAAAGVAALLWIGAPDAFRDQDAPDEAGLTTLERAFGHDLSEQEFRMIVSGRADPEALLLVAAGEG